LDHADGGVVKLSSLSSNSPTWADERTATLRRRRRRVVVEIDVEV
jgi:hypothetical protein